LSKVQLSNRLILLITARLHRRREVYAMAVEYRLTPEGYLVAQSSALGEEFKPGLFPGLTINLAELLGVPLAEETSEIGE